MEKPTIALVLLTYNEIDGITKLLPEFKNLNELNVDEIFAVDGGSTDGTLDEYKKYGVDVCQQTSRGRGEAMRLARQHSKCSHLVFFSPDGNENHKDIPKFREYFERDYDLVIASRMMEGSRNEEDDQFLKLRKWANNTFNLCANLFFRKSGPYITDSINGFRGMKTGLLDELKLDAIGYTIEYQMTIRSFKTGKKIVEFPTYEGNRIGGETKAYAIPTGLRFLALLFREIFLAKRFG